MSERDTVLYILIIYTIVRVSQAIEKSARMWMSELRAHFLSLQLQQQQQQKHRSPAQSSTNLTAAITAVTITNLTHSGAVEIPKTEEQTVLQTQQ